MNSNRGSHVEQSEDLQVRHGPVVGTHPLPRHGLTADLAEKSPQKKRGALRTALQDLLEDFHPLLDPDERRSARNGFLAAPEKLQLNRELVAPLLGSEESVGQRAAPPPFSDELDEIGNPPLLAFEIRFLEPDGVRRLRGGPDDLFLDSSEDIGQVLGARQFLPDRGQDDSLGERSPNEEPVLAIS